MASPLFLFPSLTQSSSWLCNVLRGFLGQTQRGSAVSVALRDWFPKEIVPSLGGSPSLFSFFLPPPVIFSKPQNSPTPGIIVLIQRWHAVNRENSWPDSWAPLSSAGMHDTTFTCAQTHTGHTLKPTGKASAGQNSAGHYEAQCLHSQFPPH